MLISRIAITRPVLTTMVLMALIVFGVISYKRLGVDMFPRIDLPVITITVALPGADPETIEREVIEPLEESVNTLSKIKNINSQSSQGVGVIAVEFDMSKDVEIAFQEVQARVARVRGELNRDIREPVIEKVSFDSSPVMTAVVAGDLPLKELDAIVRNTIKPRLERVAGVGAIELIGTRKQTMWIWLDSERMDRRGITTAQIRQTVEQSHLTIPGGKLRMQGRELQVTTRAECITANDFARLPLLDSQGKTLHLSDVAVIEEGLAEDQSHADLDGAPCIAFQVRRQSGSNTVEVCEGVKKALTNVQKELSANVRVEVAQDMSNFIRRSLGEVEESLVFGGIMVTLVVLLFLANWRSTLISSLVLPTSVIGTFIVFLAFGFTLNFMTLLALTLAIGLLIDDAMVVQENIMRHVQAGMDRKKAAFEATAEVGLAVMATSLAVVAVFVPVAYTEGIIGKFFFPFGIAISAAVLISMLISFTLDPMLSSRFLVRIEKPNFIQRTVEGFFHHLAALYRNFLGLCLRQRWFVVLIALGILGGAAWMMQFVKTEFEPSQDTSEFMIGVEIPIDADISVMRKTLSAIRERVKQQTEVRYTLGMCGTGKEALVTKGNIYVRLKERKARQHSQPQLEQIIRDDLVAQNDPLVRQAKLSVQKVDYLENGGEMGFAVLWEISGPDLGELERIATAQMEKLRNLGGYTDLSINYDSSRPEITVAIDRDRAARAGVSPAALGRTVMDSIGGMDLARYTSAGERYDVRFRLLEGRRQSQTDIGALRIPSVDGTSVALSSLATAREELRPRVINHANRQRMILLQANLVTSGPKAKTQGEAAEELRRVADEVGLPPGYHCRHVGMVEVMEESFKNLGITMILSVLMIYMIMAAQFESFLHPFTILLTLPLAFVGSIAALLVTGQTQNIFSMMAFIFLLGLVTKNAILLIDYTNILRRRDGVPMIQALLTAGPIRLRPILMTTIAMIVGMLPIALSRGEGSESRVPMAVAIIGGLISSTLLSLVVVPVVYSLFEDAKKYLGKLLKISPPT